MAVWEKYSKLFIVVPISPRFDPRREVSLDRKDKEKKPNGKKKRERERKREIDRQIEREREIKIESGDKGT